MTEQPKKKHDESESLASILKEISASAKDLVQSERLLIQSEIRETTRILGRHVALAGIFAALMAISVFPFLAFLVIGIGRLMGGRYTWSSLIVAVFCAVVGGALSFWAYRRLQHEDLTLPRTRDSLAHQTELLREEARELRDAAKVKEERMRRAG